MTLTLARNAGEGTFENKVLLCSLSPAGRG